MLVDVLGSVCIIKVGISIVLCIRTGEKYIRLKIVKGGSLSKPDLECCEIVRIFKRRNEVRHPRFNSEFDESWKIRKAA
jgi:hypothetical protein